jgi:type I restriction enzyme S subunit
MSGWQELKWGDLATLEYGKALREYQNSQGEYVVYGTNGPIGRTDSPLCRYATVIVGRKGAYRGIHYAPEPCFVIDTAFYLKPRTQFDVRWAYYQLLTQDINAMDSGSAIPSTSRDEFYQLRVRVPPVSEQRAIAHVLGALDDKIELNRRMNETLEAIAQALFEKQFVHATVTGLPTEWEIQSLADLTQVITKGTTPTRSDIAGAPAADRQINYLRVNAISEDGSILDGKLMKIPESVHSGVLKRSILKRGDVLYTIAGTIGRTTIVEALLPANCNQAVAIIRPKTDIPSGFLLLWLQQRSFQEELHSNVVHAVQANLSLGMISKARIATPAGEKLSGLFEPIDKILKKIIANRSERRTLTALRNTLLPKLLSGAIRFETTH